MGKITIDELSNELKEYMNGLGLTEEQVNQLVENFSGNKTELLTTNKTDLVAAINELFQNANNGKELIATAIGEPLTAEDTFSAMSSGINNLNSQFKSALMTNGVSVESSDKFKQLIEKLSLIADSEGKGIQYASGSATSEILYSDVYGVKVDNLNFKPDIILIQANTYNGIIYNGLVSTTEYVSFSATSGKAFGELMNTYTYVNENRFSLKSPGIDDVNWYAIGVGEEDTTLEDTLRDILANKGVEVSAEDDLASLITKVDNIVPKGYELLPSWKKLQVI